MCVRACARVCVCVCVWWGEYREELSDHRTFGLAILPLFSCFSVIVFS